MAVDRIDDSDGTMERHRTGVLPALIENGRDLLRRWLVKRRTRRSLTELTRDQLADIGVTPGEAQAEVAKSFFWS